MKLTHVITIPAIALAALVTQPFIVAQDGPPPANRSEGDRGPGKEKGRKLDPEMRINKLKELLTLTPDQETKVREIFAKGREEIRAHRQANKDNRPTKENAQKFLKEHREKMDAAIRGVLTPDQQTKWDAHLAERKERREKWAEAKGGSTVPTP